MSVASCLRTHQSCVHRYTFRLGTSEGWHKKDSGGGATKAEDIPSRGIAVRIR